MEVEREMTRIKVTVASVSDEHPCAAGLEVGDSFVVELANHALSIPNETVKCGELLHTVFPMIMTVAHGGRLPWGKEGKANSACPDPMSRVVVSIEKLEEGTS